MIYALLKLHGLAQQRGDGLLPEFAESLRKIQRLSDGRLTVLAGDADDQGVEKDADRSKVEQTSSRGSDKTQKAG
jgi:hypothetical protein